MKRIKIYLLLFVILIGISGASFYCGGKVGFNQGYFYCDAQQTGINAALATETLLRIRDNKIDRALNLLESSLDVQFAGDWISHQKFPSFYGIRFYDKKGLQDKSYVGLMKKACMYRKDHPYKKDKKIESVLNYYLSKDN